MKKHILKHAKRAHAHVQDHGHKWLWLLCTVFAIILVYPYFTSADEPLTETCEEGYILDENEQCVESTPEVCNDEQASNFEEEGECTYDTDEPESIPLTGTITYNPSTQTTDNVTATITGFSTTGVIITNNSGNNTYIFTDNGSFIFEFENADGVTGAQTATVDWIQEQIDPTPTCDVDIITPISGAIVGSTLDIQRSSTIACDTDQDIIIQLRDHNEQWITLGTGVLEDEQATFSTTGLVSTGFYTITGIHLSGATREIENSSGAVIESGFYTEDTPYIVYTGAYTGEYTDFATGYMIRLLGENENILTQSLGIFTIDNQAPTLTNLNMSFSNVVSGTVGTPSIGTISFSGSELLTGVSFTILGTNVAPSTTVHSGDIYTFTVPLANVAATGAIVLTAYVQDLAGNKASIYGTSAIIFNNHIPNIRDLDIKQTSGAVLLSWNTDVDTRFDFSYTKSGTDSTTQYTGSEYSTEHEYTIQTIQTGHTYIFTLSISDVLGNQKSLSGDITISTTGSISVDFNQDIPDILKLSPEAETNLYLQILQAEVQRFQACKAQIHFTQANIPVGEKSMELAVPTINRQNTRTIMGGFLMLLTSKIKDRSDLSQNQITQIQNAINNFLIVLKLNEDDGETCEQRMSNYYIGVFENMMTEMKFF